LYEYNWYDIEDFLRDQEGRSAVSEIEQAYEEWIQEKAYDYESMKLLTWLQNEKKMNTILTTS